MKIEKANIGNYGNKVNEELDRYSNGLGTNPDITIKIGNKKAKVKEQFFMAFTAQLKPIVIQKKVSLFDIAVLLEIIDIAQFGNLVSLNQGYLADKLKVLKPAISRSYNKLIKVDLLIKDKHNNVFLNPRILNKGDLNKTNIELYDLAESKLTGDDLMPFEINKKQSLDKTKKAVQESTVEVLPEVSLDDILIDDNTDLEALGLNLH